MFNYYKNGVLSYYFFTFACYECKLCVFRK